MSLQRNLKALGTFGYQTTTRQNPVYIQYMPRTLRHVRRNLERYPRFGRLQELLATFIDVGGCGRQRQRILPFSNLQEPNACVSASRRTSTTTGRWRPSTCEELAEFGFRDVELFATIGHFDYHDQAAIDALAGWLREARARAALGSRADRRTPLARGVGAGALHGVRGRRRCASAR